MRTQGGKVVNEPHDHPEAGVSVDVDTAGRYY